MFLCIAKGVFLVGNIFLLHLMYKMHDLNIIYIVIINVKKNIVKIAHFYLRNGKHVPRFTLSHFISFPCNKIV